MAEFKTPTTEKCRSRLKDIASIDTELETPLGIPASPFLSQIGYGTGVFFIYLVYIALLYISI